MTHGPGATHVTVIGHSYGSTTVADAAAGSGMRANDVVLVGCPGTDLAQSADDHVKIFVGLKLYGYRIEDIDLVVIGHFAKPRPFDVEYKFCPRDGEPFIPRRAAVKNFILVIEAKSHDATGVKFDDKIASVRYGRGGRTVWEPVTEKNRQQMFEFKRYLAEHGASRVYVQDLIYFSGLRESDLPKRPHNCFGVDASFERILNILGQVSAPQHHHRDNHRALR